MMFFHFEDLDVMTCGNVAAVESKQVQEAVSCFVGLST